ncbi:hypothetical protein JCM10449v2_003122 [Rhodotorula kratochvilovae]
MRGYSTDDFNSSAQEELLDDPHGDAQATARGYDDPYRWERPLDAVNRHSRLLDAAPIYTSPSPASSSTNVSDGRRLSRLPPGVALVDPFGFNVSNEPSPYDLAYAHSAAAQSAGLTSASSSSPRALARSSFLGPYPSMGGGASAGGGPGVTASPTISPSPSTSSVVHAHAVGELGAPGQPWAGKPRAASAGEGTQGPRAQVRNGLLAPGLSPRQSSVGRSKLSGEVDADAMSIASIASRQPANIPAVPSESDYLNSKVYQRTLKAQRALEKERAKAAAKGKVSRYDSSGPASKSTSSLASTTSTGAFGAFGLGGLGNRRRSVDGARPPSVMSAAGVSGTTSAKRGGRKTLGWFRSSSEAALTLSEGVEVGPGLPASKSSSGISLQAGARGASVSAPPSGQISPRLGVVGGPAPPLPPSPNLPSEATLRAMGVSTDQLRAAAQRHNRPKSSGRQSSGGTIGKRSPMPSPRLEQGASAFASPSPPGTAQPSRDAGASLGPPQLGRPGPPPRGTSLDPAPSSTPSTPFTTPPSTGTHTPMQQPLSSVPPRTASRVREPETVPLPPSASPTQTSFPPSATAPPPAPTLAAPASPPSSAPLPCSVPQQQQAARPLAASLPAGAAPPSPEAQLLSAPGASEFAPQATVKRRKSGLGMLFGGSSSGGGGGSGSAEGSREGSPTPSSGSSSATATAREKERMVKRMEERAQQQQQQSVPAKLTKESRPAVGGFFARSASKLRSSGGPSSAPAPSGPQAPPPPKGAAPPAIAKAKKADEPFFHPSQALHAARAAPAPPSPQQQSSIRAVNPSPQLPQPATMMRHHPSGGAYQDPVAVRTDSSSGSSTTFSSLSSSASTLPPSTPAGHHPLTLDGKGPVIAPLPAKKGGFASLFSIGGSIRGRKSSAPVPLSSAPGPKLAQAPPPVKTLPVLPQAPPPAASLRKSPRGQSLATSQSASAQGGQQQQGELASHRPYATYA